jgi:phosphoribosyl-ATP pyrophosphohydrolase
VLLAEGGVSFADVLAELEQREGMSGIDEKAARTK